MESEEIEEQKIEENIKENIEESEQQKQEKIEKEKKASKKRAIIFNFMAVICIALYCIAISPKTLQNDTYYTVTIGEYIYNNGIGDLTTDMYSWHELPYTYPHWLYDLGMFVIYNKLGQLGIYISTMVLAAILGISIYALCCKKSKNRLVSFLLTIGSCFVLKSFIAARAQLVTFIIFAWTVFVIEKFLETKKIRYAALLIIFPLLIANLHCAVFPFYFVLFLPYIGEYLLVCLEDTDWDYKIFGLYLKLRKKLARKPEKKEKIEERIDKLAKSKIERKEKREKIRENPYKVKVTKNHAVLLLMIIMVVAATTGFINPAGTGAYTYLYKTMKGNTTGSINEHLPLTLVENDEFCVTIIIFIIVLLFTDSKIKLSDLFMLAGITYLSFKSRRQVSMFAIFCIPILASLIAQFIEKYDKDVFDKIERYYSEWFGVTVVICLFVIWCTNLIKPNINSDYIDGSSYPIEAAEWIKANLDVKNIRLYNEYNYGSYLLFKGIPVFIDSRCDLYTPQFNGTYNKEEKYYDGRDIFSDAINIAGLGVNYKDKFEEYDVSHIILYNNSKLAMVLESDPNYNKLYDQGSFVIFERLDATANQDN